MGALVDKIIPMGAGNSDAAIPLDKQVTTLPANQEAAFQDWVKTNNIRNDDSANSDYDMRGYYKDVVMTGQEKVTTSKSDGQRHYPDTYKRSNHESFSNESKYATKNAPSWTKAGEGWQLVRKNGQVVKNEPDRDPNPSGTVLYGQAVRDALLQQ